MTQAFQPYRTIEDDLGVETEFCIEGVHITFWSQYARHHGGSTGWQVTGACDGSCRSEIHPCVPELVSKFKETGLPQRCVLHTEPSDEELECR